MYRQTIDSGGRTHLPMCSCGWRGMPTCDRDGARLQNAHHEARAHPGTRTGRDAARAAAYRRR